QQAKASAAWIRLADSLVNLFERVLDVRKPVMSVLDRVLEELLPELAKLTEHPVEARITDRVLLLWRSRNRRKSYFPKAELLGEMTIDPRHVDRFRGQGHPSPDGTGAMFAQQLLDLRRDDVVTAGAIVKDTELVLQFFRAVHRDGDANLVLGEKLDDVRPQQR